MHHHNRGGKNKLMAPKLSFSHHVRRTKPHRVKQLPKSGNRSGRKGGKRY